MTLDEVLAVGRAERAAKAARDAEQRMFIDSAAIALFAAQDIAPVTAYHQADLLWHERTKRAEQSQTEARATYVETLEAQLRDLASYFKGMASGDGYTSAGAFEHAADLVANASNKAARKVAGMSDEGLVTYDESVRRWAK